MTAPAWLPVNVFREEWGTLQLVVGGADVTYFRGVPAQVSSWSNEEPFDDATLLVAFPQITPYETIGEGDLWWLDPFANVEMYHVFNDNVTRVPLWEGTLGSFEDSVSQSEYSLSVACLGVLRNLQFYRQQPSFWPPTRDIGEIVADKINNLSVNYRARFATCQAAKTGYVTREHGSWQTVLEYFGELFGRANDELGNQWTLMVNEGRRPWIHQKDRTTIHWTMMTGQRGLEVSLSLDPTMQPTTIYGEGIAEDGCRWRNTKYPNLRADSAPVFPGNIIGTIGESGSYVATWKAEMSHNGWPVSMGSPSTYTANDEKQCRRFQASVGIQVDGDVGPQTWAATFETGSNVGDLQGAYMAPLAGTGNSDPYQYSASGGVLGANPYFDPVAEQRIERYENFGARVSKAEASDSAWAELVRENDPAHLGWNGTLTLSADPQEGSRFGIRAGHNILLRQHRGADRLLHIAKTDVSWGEMRVTLTVDDRARDLMTISAIRSRDRELSDPSNIKRSTRRRSAQTQDTMVTWDCENGAGVIPYHATYGGLWNVLRIPAGEEGNVVKTWFRTVLPSRFAVGVFDRPTTAADIVYNMTVPSPLQETGGAQNPWDILPESTGLMIAWGGPESTGDVAAGYYPAKAPPDPLTGVLQDNAQWYYKSSSPPWLWVALWTEVSTYIEGRLYPANDVS